MDGIEVTDHDLREAFALFAWAGWTFDAAMADPWRARLVHARAGDQARKRFEATHTRTVRLVRRCHPETGRWCTQRVPGDYDERQLGIN